MGKVTIRDIAAATGVTISTVNKALNGKSGVSEEKRAEIISAAKKLGYKANRAAQSLARKPIKLGVAFPDTCPEYFENIRAGITEALGELSDLNVHGIAKYYAMDVSATESAAETIAELRGENVDAIIFSPGYRYEYKSALEKAGSLPVLTVGSDTPYDCISRVHCDSSVCGRLAAELLGLEKNAESAVIIGNLSLISHDIKCRAFSSECLKSGMPEPLKYEVGENEEAAREAAEDAVRKGVKGIYVGVSFCSGVCRAVLDSNKSVKVVTTDVFEDVRRYMEAGVITATVCQRNHAQGRRAVELLYKYLADGVLPERDYTLIPRAYLPANYPG